MKSLVIMLETALDQMLALDKYETILQLMLTACSNPSLQYVKVPGVSYMSMNDRDKIEKESSHLHNRPFFLLITPEI